MPLSRRTPARIGAATLALGAATLVAAPAASAATPQRDAGLPAVTHIFQIVLENKSFDETFGPDSPATYLNGTLVPQGQLLTQYYGTGHFSLDNYISMVSGQAPNPQTQSDCQNYVDVEPGTPFNDPTTAYDEGQVNGSGCIYPSGGVTGQASVATLGSQLTDAGLTWHGYMEDLGNTPGREQATCGQPGLGTANQDQTQSATAQDQYAARHNPFVYFHSIVDDQAYCRAHVTPLTPFDTNLATAASTSNWSFITPDLCHDAHDATCANPSQQGGLKGADSFLQSIVPKIQASPAYADGGLIVITFDESEASGDSAACCAEPTGPNTTTPGITGPGGGRMGTLLLSPFVTAGTVNDTPYNHYSLLRSEENLLGVGSETRTGLGGGDGMGHLGYAAMPGLKPFGAEVFDPQPGSDVPEAPYAVLLGVAGLAAVGGVVTLRRRGPAPS